MSAYAAPAKWYENGGLQNATAAQWNAAPESQKIATCADMIASMWMKKDLRPDIQKKIRSMDDLKPYCVILSQEIDKAFADSVEGVPVREAAAAIIILLKWEK